MNAIIHSYHNLSASWENIFSEAFMDFDEL